MEALGDFVDEAFDPPEYSRIALATHGGTRTGVDGYVENIRTQLQTVNNMITNHIEDNYQPMLTRLEVAKPCKDAIMESKSLSNTLSASVGRLNRDVSLPLENMKNQAKQLRNIQKAILLITRSRRFLKAILKIQSSSSSELKGGRELSKKSQLVAECESMLSDGSLREIACIKDELHWFVPLASEIRSSIRASLRLAICEANQLAEVGALSQAFFHLGELHGEIFYLVDWVVNNISSNLKSALDIKNLSESKKLKPQKGEEKEWKNQLWSNISTFENTLRTWAIRMWNLGRVLSKKRDAVSHQCLGDLFTKEPVYDRFWNQMTRAINGEIQNASRAYPFIRSSLGVQDYPRLRQTFRQIPAKLFQRTRQSISDEVSSILRSLQPLLEVYLAQSLRRLNEPVELMFPVQHGDKLPTNHDVTTFVKSIENELVAAKCDPDLTVAVGRGAAKAVFLFANKAKLAVTPSESPLNLSVKQKETDTVHNISILQLVLRLKAQIQMVPGNIHEKCADESVLKNLTTIFDEPILNQVSDMILGQHMISAANSLNTIICKIHTENFAPTKERDMEQASPYMNTLEHAIGVLTSTYFPKLPFKEFPIVHTYLKGLVTRMVGLFSRHISLIRPLNNSGRLRIARDMAQFELIIAPLSMDSSFKLSSIGDPYKELRALRQLLFIDLNTFQAVDEKLVDKYREFIPDIRTSTIWHCIFADAPDALRSPSMLVEEIQSGYGKESSYISWMDQIENEKETYFNRLSSVVESQHLLTLVWDNIASCLDKYMQVRSADHCNDAVCHHYQVLQSLRRIK